MFLTDEMECVYVVTINARINFVRCFHSIIEWLFPLNLHLWMNGTTAKFNNRNPMNSNLLRLFKNNTRICEYE